MTTDEARMMRYIDEALVGGVYHPSARALSGRVLGWIDEGRKHGYPGCCVRYFVVRALRDRTGWPVPGLARLSPDDGRIMCDKCASRFRGPVETRRDAIAVHDLDTSMTHP